MIYDRHRLFKYPLELPWQADHWVEREMESNWEWVGVWGVDGNAGVEWANRGIDSRDLYIPYHAVDSSVD